MSGKNINFDDNKIKRSSFYNNKMINNIEDIDANNILVCINKSHTVQKILTNTLSDIMIMIILYHYV